MTRLPATELAPTSVPVGVLLVDDDRGDYLLTRQLLLKSSRLRCELEWVARYEDALETMLRGKHDVYLVDYRLGARTGLDLLREAVAAGCARPIILLTGQG